MSKPRSLPKSVWPKINMYNEAIGQNQNELIPHCARAQEVHTKAFCNRSQFSGTVSDEMLIKRVFKQINKMNNSKLPETDGIHIEF